MGRSPAVAVIGGFFRFWHLDRPHELVFDETYDVKQAYSYLKAGYELAWRGPARTTTRFTKGNLDIFLKTPYFVVHPPVGKWMIASGSGSSAPPARGAGASRPRWSARSRSS